MTAVLYALAIIGFLTLLIAAYLAGSRLGAHRHPIKRKEERTLEKLRCECRRYAYPSPLCPLHGRRTA